VRYSSESFCKDQFGDGGTCVSLSYLHELVPQVRQKNRLFISTIRVFLKNLVQEVT
jgi:hypothetical protein